MASGTWDLGLPPRTAGRPRCGVRIIGGLAANRLLKVPAGLSVRPTPDLVRQAIFNSLGGRVVAARVLDLFSGTAALGLECLSRGAAQVLSVELSAKHARLLAENVRATGLPADRHELRVQDVFTALPQLAAAGRQFDLVLADPPYGDKNVGRRSTSVAQMLLDHPALPGLLAANGLCVLGHARRDQVEIPPAWSERRTMKHGDSWMRFLEAAQDPP